MIDPRRIGGVCALIGAIMFIVAWSAAIAATPGYRFAGQWVSDLGVGGGAAFFGSGVILAGILIIPVAVGLVTSLRLSRIGILAGIVLATAGVALMMVGIFTENAGRIHWIVSVVFFFPVMLAFLLFSLAFYRPKKWRLLSPVTAALLLTGLILAAVDGAGPLSETATVMLIIIWSLIVGSRLLTLAREADDAQSSGKVQVPR